MRKAFFVFTSILTVLATGTVLKVFVYSPPGPPPVSFNFANCTLPSNTTAIGTTAVARPTYSQSNPSSTSVTPADFNTKIVRVSGETNTSITGLGVVWGTNKGPDYTKTQPWNADESVLAIYHAVAGSGGMVFADGTTYVPIVAREFGNGVTYGGIITCPCYFRWHPTKKDWMIVVDDTGDIAWWNPITNVFKSKFVAPAGFTSVVQTLTDGDEPTASRDGDRFLVAGNSGGIQQMFVVGNLNGASENDVSGARVSPFYTSANLGWDAGGIINNGMTLAQNGNYAWVSGSWPEMVIVNFNGGAGGAVVKTAIPSQGHQDACIDNAGNDVLWDAGSSRMILMSNPATTTTLTPAWSYPDYWHTSCQNFLLSGWGIGSSEWSTATVFAGEIVAVELKAAGTYRRLAHHRTQITATGTSIYDHGPFAVPSPSGSRVMFRSDWGDAAGHDADAYILELNNSAPCQ
jgi:hypothetical protein